MAWPRVHLFEWNDRSWFPDVLRRGETDYLATVLALGKPFHPLAPKIAALLDSANTDTVIDLASGGAGPWRQLAGEVAAQRGGRAPHVVLTDLFPRRRNSELVVRGQRVNYLIGRPQ